MKPLPARWPRFLARPLRWRSKTGRQQWTGRPHCLKTLLIWRGWRRSIIRQPQDCLASGDWACYGREQQALKDALEALVALTQPAEEVDPQ